MGHLWVPPDFAKGSLIVGQERGWKQLSVGADGEVLTADSSEPSGVKWSAAGSGSATPAAKAHLTSNDSSSGTVTYDVEDFDTGSDFDPATGLFTAPTTGILIVHFVHHAAGSSVGGVFAQVVKNGSNVWPYHRYTVPSSSSVDWTTHVQVSSGDEVGVSTNAVFKRGDAAHSSATTAFFTMS